MDSMDNEQCMDNKEMDTTENSCRRNTMQEKVLSKIKDKASKKKLEQWWE